MRGSFEAVVHDAGLTENKFGRGSERMVAEIQFLIKGGENDGAIVGWSEGFSDEVFGGKSRTQWTFEALRTLGLKDDDLSALESLKGARANVTVEEGKNRSFVKYINPPGGFSIKRTEKSNAQEFAERMKAKMRGNGAQRQPSGGSSFNPNEWDEAPIK
jgi:hypothetical protein